jgi:hypothetical protein
MRRCGVEGVSWSRQIRCRCANKVSFPTWCEDAKDFHSKLISWRLGCRTVVQCSSSFMWSDCNCSPYVGTLLERRWAITWAWSRTVASVTDVVQFGAWNMELYVFNELRSTWHWVAFNSRIDTTCKASTFALIDLIRTMQPWTAGRLWRHDVIVRVKM